MKTLLLVFLGIITLFVGAVGLLWSWLPSEAEIKGCMVTKMYQVDLCPTSKNYTKLNQISPYLTKTVILTEDSSFYVHKGFDWESIEKNAREGWDRGVFRKGGSTITQQLAKNLFLNKDRTFIRTGLEAIITDRIEKTLTKKEILERYLNVVEFGKNIYGVKAAAKHYFQKSPSELNIVESAFLAMVLPSPIKYSQSYYRKELTPFAKKRLRKIIDDMLKYHRINDEEYTVASAQLDYFFQPEPLAEEFLPTGEEQVPSLQDLENVDPEEEL